MNFRVSFVIAVVASLVGCTFEVYKNESGKNPELDENLDAGAGGATSSNTVATTTTGSVDPNGPEGEWLASTGNLEARTVPCAFGMLALKPDNDAILAGIEDDAIWMSLDGGHSWDGLGVDGLSDRMDSIPNSAVFDPDDPATFWISGIYGWGLFRTTDNGKTFVQQGDLRHSDYASVDFTDPRRRTIVAGAHEKRGILNLSLDGGDTWTDIGERLPEECGWASAPHVIDKDTFLVGCTTGIARTTNGGDDFEYVSEAGGASAPLVASDGTIYWAAQQGMARSPDKGKTWTLVSPEVLFWPRHPIELPDGRLAATGRQAIVASDDQGESWQTISPPFPYTPRGIVYSATEKAFFAWRLACVDGVQGDDIIRYDFDYADSDLK